MTNELETQDRSEELKLNELDAVVAGAAATPDNSGAGKPAWAGDIAPGQVK